MDLALLRALNEARAARRAALLVTDLAGGAQRLVAEREIAGDPLAAALETRLRAGRSGLVQTEAGEVFVTVQVPPPRIVVTGAVHISQAMAPMARLLDLDLVIVDPRTAFATPERFPDVSLLAEWPDEVLPQLGLDDYTAFVALSHDPKIDDPGLTAALRSDCFYVGALGSRKTHGKRVGRLEAAGFDAQAIGRIHAPVGLDIGATSPAEVALAVLADIVRALRGPKRAVS